MPRTRGDLCARALFLLGKAEAGQSPAVEDVAEVDRLIDDVGKSLTRLRIVYEADLGRAGDLASGDIPGSEFLPLADFVALAAAPGFTVPDAPLAARAARAEAQLRAMQAETQTDEPIRFTAY